MKSNGNVHALSVNICVCHDHLLDHCVLTSDSHFEPFFMYLDFWLFYVIVNYSSRVNFYTVVTWPKLFALSNVLKINNSCRDFPEDVNILPPPMKSGSLLLCSREPSAGFFV
jgi:hypothetical protein